MLFARFSALPSKLPTRLAHLAGASVLAAVLAACGGSDTPRTSAVKVVGDSLADSGTFGNKYTVQSAAGSPTLIWTDHVTAAVDVPALCARYTSDASGNVSLNAAAPACTSFAVAGATINPTGTARDTTGYSIVQQLKDLGSSSYQFEDLLLVDGGGNDAAALLGAFIGASTPAGYAAYVTLLGELLSAAQLAAINPANPTTLVAAGSQYMVALANLLVDTLDAQAMAKGAQRVLVMNMPNVVRTPRFQTVLAAVTAQAGAATAAQVSASGMAWVNAYNTQLASRLAGRSTAKVVDVAGTLNGWLDAPATFGFTNATTPACPVVGSSGGLPSYNLATCTAALLSANPPAGLSGADWWRTYVFADNFHATPRANQMIGDLFIQALEAAHWK